MAEFAAQGPPSAPRGSSSDAKTAVTSGHRLRLVLFAALTAACVLNALRLWGDRTALWGDAALQTTACVGAIAVGLVVARRATGASRLWRLLVVAAMASWFSAQLMWWWQVLVVGARPTPLSVAVIAHFMFPILAALALLVLARACETDGPGGPRERRSAHSVVTTILDALVATASFAILVWSAGSGAPSGFSLPRSGGRPLNLAYPFVTMLVVVLAVLLVLACRSHRRYRGNLLLLAAGVVTIAASERLVAYFAGIDVHSGELWARSGFVLGALLVAFALTEKWPRSSRRIDRREQVMDWSQLTVPYVGAIGINVLLGFHVLMGHPLDRVQTFLAVLVVFLLVARQLVSLLENRLLMRRVFAGQHRLIHQIHHDSLTRLPNRLLFAQRLDAAVADGRPFVLAFVDLDDFKDVNDQFGHAAGDQLLDAVGRRLLECAGPTDTVARIGGDEFAILVPGHVGPPEIFADRIRSALRAPFALQGSSVKVKASMGLVMPDPSSPDLTSDELLRRADTSMYAGKRLGKNSAVLYHQSSADAVDFPTAMRRAPGTAPLGFSLVYQPIVQLPGATVVAVEALARWTAPNGTQIPPETFVAAAEAAGLGADFDTLVLDLACGEISAAGMTVSLHVNMGAARLGNQAFERAVADALDRHGIAPGRLILELTESVPIVDLADATDAIRRLKDIGVRVALDDFGAGYNSLTYLHALPVDMIKLDRALTVGIEADHDAALYRSVIGLCEDLKLDVVAEGIETAGQAETIYSAGCRLAQGYRFGRPAPLADLASVVPALTTVDTSG